MDPERRKEYLRQRERNLTITINVAMSQLREVQTELLRFYTEETDLTVQRKKCCGGEGC